MRVLVTGATGFVGRALVPALTRDNYEVRAAVRGNIESRFLAQTEIVRHGDLGSPIDWSPLVAGCDAIVHLAGIAHSGPEISAAVYERVNHQAASDLVRAARSAAVGRFVFVSSIRAQSGPTADHVLTETDTAHPTDPYGASKLAAEKAVLESGLPYTILRPTLVYGAGVKGNLAALARLAASPLPLPFAGLSSRRSLLNRASLIDAIILSLRNEAATGQIFIVADRQPIALNVLVAAIRAGLGRAPGLFSVPGPLLRTSLNLM